jgi:hypothetical protein
MTTIIPFVFYPHERSVCIRPACSERAWRLVKVFCLSHCFYCANFVPRGCETKDHLVPVSRRGCPCCENLVLSCLSCNSMKRNRTVEEFIDARPAFANTVGMISTRDSVLKRDSLLRATVKNWLCEEKSDNRIYRVPDDAPGSLSKWRNSIADQRHSTAHLAARDAATLPGTCPSPQGVPSEQAQSGPGRKQSVSSTTGLASASRLSPVEGTSASRALASHQAGRGGKSAAGWNGRTVRKAG